MIILIKLLLAHFIGDFLLQPKSWVKAKEEKKALSIKLYLHLLIHGILTYLVLWNRHCWSLVVMLIILHGVIDVIKLYAQKDSSKTIWFFIDQTFHISSILVLWSLFFKPSIDINAVLNNEKIWIYAMAVLFVTVVSAIIIKELMSSWSNALKVGDEESLSDAGKYIGILERLFTFMFVVTGRWEGIGFLLTAKSIFRFGDLKESKERKLTEYILIGTLLSFGIAVIVGLLVHELTK